MTRVTPPDVVLAVVPGAGLVPPAQYSPLWMVLAFAIVVGAVLLLIAAVRLTRGDELTVPASDISWMPPVDRAALRAHYLVVIDDAAHAHQSGRLSTRQLHQQLGHTLRQFAAEAHGVSAASMTLTDLREARLAALSDAVERLYPGEFSAAPNAHPDESVHAARQLVMTWS